MTGSEAYTIETAPRWMIETNCSVRVAHGQNKSIDLPRDLKAQLPDDLQGTTIKAIKLTPERWCPISAPDEPDGQQGCWYFNGQCSHFIRGEHDRNTENKCILHLITHPKLFDLKCKDCTDYQAPTRPKATLHLKNITEFMESHGIPIPSMHYRKALDPITKAQRMLNKNEPIINVQAAMQQVGLDRPLIWWQLFRQATRR